MKEGTSALAEFSFKYHFNVTLAKHITSINYWLCGNSGTEFL
jgi:hypothetical protein